MSLPPFELNAWFARAEGRFDLSVSHSACRSLSIADLIGENWPEFASTTLSYGPHPGLGALCESIANEYDSIQPDDVLACNGPSEAIYTFARTVLKRGDRVVAMMPSFPSLHAIARHKGCEVVPWRPRDEETFRFDVDELRQLVDDTTKLIVINFPHNPTGRTITSAELTRLVEIARQANAIVLSDEVFRLLELPPLTTLPAVCDLYERGISISGLSKPFGLGGLRIGWMASRDRDVLQKLMEYRYYTAEMTNTPCQLLAVAALQQKESILATNIQLIRENLGRLSSFVDSTEGTLSLLTPQAGPMAVVEQRTGMPSAELCERVLEEERVFMVPGEYLGLADRYLRFGLGREELTDALPRVRAFLERHKPKPASVR